eukprot:TRINITY_DN12092_c0_g1_i1.p1 TRINITY_DN12092_c0_g1~~TRINITY_DN12092_c0_g1_i1.p1  ORF type:complete len:123 (+),score=22.87 TRINITY_DN12092_c0_g1_i1:2-370(+)
MQQSNTTSDRLNEQSQVHLPCVICKTPPFTSIIMRERHLQSKKHRRKASLYRAFDAWDCKVCQVKCRSYKEWTSHLVGMPHHKKLMEERFNLAPIDQQQQFYTLAEVQQMDHPKVAFDLTDS